MARLVEFSFENRDADKDAPWSPDEVQRFLKAADGDQLYPAFVMIFYLGLRRGEALGVRWADVDWSGREINIRKQSQRAGHSLHLSDVKTRAGRRPLPLLGVVRDALTDHQDLQDEWRDKAGDRWEETGLVITTRSGRQIEPRNFNRSFDRIRAAAKLPHLTPHGARHTCASLLGELRVEPRAAMEILGHSRSAVTLEIYQKASSEARRRALKKVEKKLRGK